jgi:hypothetical protein
MDNRTIIQKSLDYIEDNLQTESLPQSWRKWQVFRCFTITGCFSRPQDSR